jgi:hypothetical protein
LRARQSATDMSREETGAFSRQQLRLMRERHPGADKQFLQLPADVQPPDFSDIIDDAREARKAGGFSRITQGPGHAQVTGRAANAPMPPIRPDNGAIMQMAQGFEMAASKADDAKSAVIEIGPAAQTASQQMASSFNASIDQMIAKTEMLQQKLSSLKAPSLSFGGGSGFNTGKSMPEVR